MDVSFPGSWGRAGYRLPYVLGRYTLPSTLWDGYLYPWLLFLRCQHLSLGVYDPQKCLQILSSISWRQNLPSSEHLERTEQQIKPGLAVLYSSWFIHSHHSQFSTIKVVPQTQTEREREREKHVFTPHRHEMVCSHCTDMRCCVQITQA